MFFLHLSKQPGSGITENFTSVIVTFSINKINNLSILFSYLGLLSKLEDKKLKLHYTRPLPIYNHKTKGFKF